MNSITKVLLATGAFAGLNALRWLRQPARLHHEAIDSAHRRASDLALEVVLDTVRLRNARSDAPYLPDAGQQVEPIERRLRRNIGSLELLLPGLQGTYSSDIETYALNPAELLLTELAH